MLRTPCRFPSNRSFVFFRLLSVLFFTLVCFPASARAMPPAAPYLVASTSPPRLLADIAAISAGLLHTCVLTTTGAAKCWGYNAEGRLGDGTTTNRTSPVDVIGLSSGITAISAGTYHTCALTTTGGVMCWGGENWPRQPGDDTNTLRPTPMEVTGLTTGVVAITTGESHTCALTTAGGVKCWGRSSEGQLGDGSHIDGRTSPVDVIGLSSGVTAISAGTYHTCALTTTGGVMCWGYNWGGQLGDGTKTNRAIPLEVSGLSAGVATINAGDAHTCALTTTGGVKCWGWNNAGQLGDGTTIDRTSPVEVVGLGNDTVTAISVGGSHACALTSVGGVKCWGWNLTGQLGDGTTTDRTTPIEVSGLTTGVATVSARGNHTCALTTTGGVKCWGWNGDGQLGDGTTIDRTTPGDVIDPILFHVRLPHLRQ